ncbi:MAG: FHA domain-containing protein [Bdellovibrionales bacterium]
MINLKVFEDSDVFFEDSFTQAKEITVGRGSYCDIILSGHPGISRSHFKIIIQEDLSVVIETVSKTGKLIHRGTNITDISFDSGVHTISVPPYDFTFELPEKEAFETHTASIEEEHTAEAPARDAYEEQALAVTEEETSLSPVGFDEDEKTKTAIAAPLEYSVKVFKGERLLQELALEGSSWDFGRDQDCHYTIKSKKTSRKHFTVLNIRSKFFVKDLGSSNGTFLNKQQLPVNQEIELKSGDYIEVSDFRFIFEIKDHSFGEKVKDVALIEQFGRDDVLKNLNEIDSLRESALSINDEFLKLPEKDRPSMVAQTPKKKNYLRPALLGLILIAGGLYFFQDNSSEIDSAELASIQEEKRLAKERVNAAVDKFNLGLRFYNESQFERCIFEIDEFMKYDVQTEETNGALELKNQCEIEKDRLQRKLDLEAQEEQKLAIERKIQEIVDLCAPKASEGSSVLKPCVEPAFSLDPSNEKVAELLDIAEATDLRREQEEANAEKYRKSVASGRALYKKAENYDRYGDWKRALKAYDKHIKSRYPDPGKLKKKASRNIASINRRIDGILSAALTESKKHLENDDYKNSVLAANKGLEVNRDHPELLKTKATASKNLKTILRKYYQESVIQEDFGQIDESKVLWKKILNQGIKGSDYYQKAKLKLKYYEEGV